MSREKNLQSTGVARLPTVPLSFSGFYCPEQDTLFCGHNAGFFSMCTVALWNLADLQEVRGIFPSRVDCSRHFLFFRNAEQRRRQTDMYPLFFKPRPDAVVDPRRRLPFVAHHGLYAFLD